MRILTISVHPDDETLGCGGTLLKHKADGDQLFWMVVTQGEEPRWSAAVLQKKSREVEQVAKAYGMRDFFKLGFPAAKLDTIAQEKLMTAMHEVIVKIRPEVVYLIHAGDIHTDHYASFQAALSVLKPFHMSALGVKKIMCYETLSSTDAAPPQLYRSFTPNVLYDITPYLEKKIEVMGLYETELHADPMPRGPSAMRALARYRGATVGVEYAEAFWLLREIG